MKLRLLNGKEFSPSLTTKNRGKRSGLHKQAMAVVKELYPLFTIVEELHVPEGKGLYLDIYIPQLSIVIEIQGEQHFVDNGYFHKNHLEFAKAKNRDRIKKEWCELNELQLIEFNYNESPDQWREKLKNRFNDGKV